jgi:CBS-domain-containing membrane protein
MVTMRIRSWRPAMPSISGPRSTVASNFTVTPFVSGATCWLLIVLSLYFQGLTETRPHPHTAQYGKKTRHKTAFVQHKGVRLLVIDWPE